MFALRRLSAVEGAAPGAWWPLSRVLDLREHDAAATAPGLHFRALGVVATCAAGCVQLSSVWIGRHEVLVSAAILLAVDRVGSGFNRSVWTRTVLQIGHETCRIRLRLDLKMKLLYCMTQLCKLTIVVLDGMYDL